MKALKENINQTKIGEVKPKWRNKFTDLTLSISVIKLGDCEWDISWIPIAYHNYEWSMVKDICDGTIESHILTVYHNYEWSKIYVMELLRATSCHCSAANFKI